MSMECVEATVFPRTQCTSDLTRESTRTSGGTNGRRTSCPDGAPVAARRIRSDPRRARSVRGAPVRGGRRGAGPPRADAGPRRGPPAAVLPAPRRQQDNPHSWNGRWIWRMVNSQRPLEEKMALFWHHVFATGWTKSEHTPTMVDHIEMLRRIGLANFRTLLLELSRDPAMIYWLDNNENHARSINENYGREILELFSMGIGNYTETDIKNVRAGVHRLDLRAADPALPVRPLRLEVRLQRRGPRRRREDVPRPHRPLQRRRHRRHHRPAGGHGSLRQPPPLQLLRGRRAAGAGLERQRAARPRGHCRR